MNVNLDPPTAGAGDVTVPTFPVCYPRSQSDPSLEIKLWWGLVVYVVLPAVEQSKAQDASHLCAF